MLFITGRKDASVEFPVPPLLSMLLRAMGQQHDDDDDCWTSSTQKHEQHTQSFSVLMVNGVLRSFVRRIRTHHQANYCVVCVSDDATVNHHHRQRRHCVDIMLWHEQQQPREHTILK